MTTRPNQFKRKRGPRLTPSARTYVEILEVLKDYSVDEVKLLCDKYKGAIALSKNKKSVR